MKHSFRLTYFSTILALAIFSAGCGTPSADGPADTFGLDLSMPPGASTRGAVIFVVDGVSGELFGQMLQAGELPNIKKHFVDRGLYAPCAVANTPSVTLANLTSIATGRFPGHHGIVGINWFDRNELIWRNYETIAQKNTLDGDHISPLLYEAFPEQTTASVFFQPHRGATKFFENWMSAGPPYYFGWFEFVDRLTLSRLDELAQIARERNAWPRVTFVYLLATDFNAYAFGFDSPQYRHAMLHTDRQIGRVLGDFERAGLLENLNIAFVSDHSMNQVTRVFSVDKLLEQNGLAVPDKQLWESTPFEKRLSYYQKFPCVTYGSGDRYWAICLRRPRYSPDGQWAGYEPWPARPDASQLACYPTSRGNVNLLDLLTRQEAVDAVAYAAGENTVRVCRQGGEVEFSQPGGPGMPITYRVTAGTDPLGWNDKVPAEYLSSKPAEQRDWLVMTLATDYPDLPAQITAYFRARRAGDIAVFAQPTWDFRGVNKAGHGGLRPMDMLTPMLLAGPGVPHVQIDHARTVDLVPTILELLGKPPFPASDGQSLLPR